MSVRTIDKGGPRPPLVLPSGCLSHTDPEYEYCSESDPSAIEPIEHQLRVDLKTVGPPKNHQLLKKFSHYQASPDDPDPWRQENKRKPLVLGTAEQTISNQWEEEQEYFDEYDKEWVLDEASTYLAEQIRECRTTNDPDAAIRDARRKRETWYELMPCKNLYTLFKKNTLGELLPRDRELHGTEPRRTTYEGVLVIGDDMSKDDAATEFTVNPDFIVSESSLTRHETAEFDLPVPSDYGIELPAPLLRGTYPNGSQYLLIPWSGGLTCQCPFKHEEPYRVMCKHEVLAGFVLAGKDDIFLPSDAGIDIPARARRFIDPHIAIHHSSPHVR